MGPDFLFKNEEHWPKKNLDTVYDCKEELRPLLQHDVANILRPSVEPTHFEKWERLYRAQTCFLRCGRVFAGRAKGAKTPKGPYTSQEIEEAQNSLYRLAQMECFPDEFIGLSQSKDFEISKSSPLYKLSPYLDENELIRLRGRIDKAVGVSNDVKRPIVLPKEHYISALVVAAYHARFHHLNHETVINELRQKFYISRLRQLVKKVRFNCQKCKNNRARPNCPEMAELPSSRLAAYVKPFTFVGVDCFGPINVVVGRRTEKRWGMLFTCLTIRAIHIEIAYSLSTDSCMLCIRNFISRRGTPKKIISDNGTNFHGAANEMQRSLRELQAENKPPEIEWQFNPPAAPHMGGSWERLIGSVKKVLAQIMPTRNPNDELLRSMLLEAENVVNSRPLTFVTLEHGDDEALTPNHFLIGSSNGNVPPGCFSEHEFISRKNWRKSQFVANCFWKRWVKEYLPTLTKRTKWFKKAKPLEVGDIVLVVDENLPRNTWPKGRIISVKRGRDNNVRSATIQTSTSVMERPTVKLALLEVES